MADVQLGNGYCKIANPIIEALARTRIPGEARQVFDAIIRKTYGWNKKEEVISNSQFMEMTGLSHTHVSRAIKKLVEMNIIVRTQKGTKVVKYAPNKDFDNWDFVPKKVRLRTQKGTKKTNKGTNLSPNDIVDMELDVPKDTIKTIKTYVDDSVEIELSEYFLKLLDGRNYPWSKKGKPNIQSWAGWFDKILRIDGRSSDEVKAVLSWCQQDKFWQNNILSPKKLREQYEQLVLKMRQTGAIGKSLSGYTCENPYHGTYIGEKGQCPKCQAMGKIKRGTARSAG